MHQKRCKFDSNRPMPIKQDKKGLTADTLGQLENYIGKVKNGTIIPFEKKTEEARRNLKKGAASTVDTNIRKFRILQLCTDQNKPDNWQRQLDIPALNEPISELLALDSDEAFFDL